MKLNIDMHVHTVHSKDGHIPLKNIPKYVKLKQLHGIAVTDHNKISKEIIKLGTDNQEIIIIPGIEVSTNLGHLLGLGVQTDISKKISPIEVIEEIHRQGGIAVSPHPYDLINKGVNPYSFKDYLDAIETVNASTIPFSWVCQKGETASKELHLPRLGGSDAHIIETIGDAYTEIEVTHPSTEEIFQAIKAGRTEPQGKATHIQNRMKKWLLDFSHKRNT